MELADALARPAQPPEPSGDDQGTRGWYDPDSAAFEDAGYVPLNRGERFSMKAATPSRWSSDDPTIPWT